MKKTKRRFIAPVLLIFLILAGGVSGCGKRTESASGPGAGKPATSQSGPTSPAPEQKAPEQKAPVRIILYFSDQQATYLVPEERQVTAEKGTVEEATETIIKELIKGPQNPELRRTIPEGTRLLSVSVKDGVAYINFSREFQAKHSGGSAGERMTVFSVVNSLCRLNEIKQVQFLLEGQKQESILGHADTSRPISPNWEIVAKPGK